MVSTKSSFLLAVLLILNPFMLLFFQNCSSKAPDRALASEQKEVKVQLEEVEPVFPVAKNLKIK